MHRNYTAFEEILPELLKTHAGMFSLMRDGRIVQFFHSNDAAANHGEEAFDDGIFSIFEVSDQLIALDVPEVTVAEATEAEPSEAIDTPEPVALEQFLN